ncbi:methylmalonyl-CoA mutase [Mesobacillus foraminis]|uniref:methylmalonyl-CoA mutase family protein n=1 Tax=Mesobacillus foraminis TaxID=279826 RepID=UPI001BED0AA4|nr:methylmalonyl-CoA mutase family protein [Mesobacillus foraminis]MBT2754805.1 methylmalonyl-CoA mutase [Mesobacillus foraminis]
MEIDKMKAELFPKVSQEAWMHKTKESLNGKSFESLYKNTYEDILLKPLYGMEDVDGERLPQYPGLPDFRRGMDTPGTFKDGWHVANKISYIDAENLRDKIRAALSMGQTAIAFEIKPSLFSSPDKLKDFLAECQSLGPFSINTGSYCEAFLAFMILARTESGENSEIDGFIASDPIAEAARNGALPLEEKEFFNRWEHTIAFADQQLSGVKTILVNTAPYHNGGANAVQELAIAISSGIFYLQQLIGRGWEVDHALEKLVFHYSIGANFFMETAKLRAARILWDKAMEAYGVAAGKRKMLISAETSMFTKTVLDPNVNLLRAGNEAFAAVLGGARFLDVRSFNETFGKHNAFSERIARNTQLILKAEAQLERVSDPAGGSWYIEALTHQLAQQAWDLFLEMEDIGGILEALKKEWLQTKLHEVLTKRKHDILFRKQSIIGTNVYANLSENIGKKEASAEDALSAPGSIEEIMEKVASSQPVFISASSSEAAESFQPVPSIRLAEPFEELRYKAAEIEKLSGKKPAIGLIVLGELQQHKPRVDFIRGIMAAGGIETLKSPMVTESMEAIEFIKSTGLIHICVCGGNRQYEEMVPRLIKEIKSVLPHVKLSLAGFPEEEMRKELTAGGIEKYIHAKINSWELLSNLLQELEEDFNEGKA